MLLDSTPHFNYFGDMQDKVSGKMKTVWKCTEVSGNVEAIMGRESPEQLLRVMKLATAMVLAKNKLSSSYTLPTTP